MGHQPNETGNLGRWPVIRDAIRDIALVGIASFMLLHETLSSTPNPEIILAGLAMFGVPAALRLDSKIRKNGGA